MAFFSFITVVNQDIKNFLGLLWNWNWKKTVFSKLFEKEGNNQQWTE